jgi:hypothetical protein
MKHDIFNGSGISAQIAKGMALAFFARAFEEIAGLLAPHGGAKLPDEIDPAAEHAAFTLACDMRIKNYTSAPAWRIVPAKGSRI